MTSRRRFIKILAAESALALAFVAGATPSPSVPPLRRWRGIALGAEATIQLSLADSRRADALLERCLREILRLESIFSLYDERSALRQLNRNGVLRNAPPELIDLLYRCNRYSSATGGCFDITIHPVIDCYRAHFAAGASGLPENLDQARRLVDWRRIQISGADVELPLPGMAITLNGVAQGYITDRIADLLRASGVTNTLVDIGERRAIGPHPEGRPWQIGLADPAAPDRVLDTFPLANRALASSGGYGTPLDSTGRVHHLIDPRTGLSSNHFAAIHVAAETAVEADALSTALAVARPQEADTILARFPDAQARFA